MSAYAVTRWGPLSLLRWTMQNIKYGFSQSKVRIDLYQKTRTALSASRLDEWEGGLRNSRGLRTVI